MKNYSQNNEQQIILNYFAENNILPNKIRMIDLAAYDGISLSNTYELLLQGAYNLAIECSLSVLPKLYNNYKDIPKEQYNIYPYAISPKEGVLEWFETDGDAIGSLSQQHLKKWHTTEFKRTTVECRTWQQLLLEYGTNFQFLNLDVQSINLELFNLIPEQLWKNLQLICVEYDNNKEYMEKVLISKGFKCISHNPENLIYGK